MLHARGIVIINYSIPETDVLAPYHLGPTITVKPHKEKEVVIVDPSQTTERRYRALFSDDFRKQCVKYFPMSWRDACDVWKTFVQLFPTAADSENR